MAKKNAKQKALCEAWAKPERRWFYSRKSCYARGTWPCKWGFWTDWNTLAISMGEPKKRIYREGTPESQFTLNARRKPFRLVAFWHLKRIIWLGDRKWKKDLKKG